MCYPFIGIGPRNGSQFTAEVKKLFSSLVVGNNFIIYVTPQSDALKASSQSEDCWPVVLVAELQDGKFRYVHSYLASQCQDVQKLNMLAK